MNDYLLLRHIKKPYLFFTVLLFILGVILQGYRSFQIQELSSPHLFIDEICSYNGVKNETASSANNITCNCAEEYDTLDSNRYINKVKVQCNYFKKRQFLAVFLSIFIPFGFNYLYLEKYLLFVLIFCLCCTAIVGNCIRFTISSHKNYFKNKINLLFSILGVAAIVIWILNIILMCLGIVLDGNSKEMFRDLYFLFNIES